MWDKLQCDYLAVVIERWRNGMRGMGDCEAHALMLMQ